MLTIHDILPTALEFTCLLLAISIPIVVLGLLIAAVVFGVRSFRNGGERGRLQRAIETLRARIGINGVQVICISEKVVCERRRGTNICHSTPVMAAQHLLRNT